MLALFGQIPTAAIANLAVTGAKIANATLANSKRLGYLGQGTATLVAGTVTVTPALNATAATDVWSLYDSTVGGGADGAIRISAITAGVAGVGNFTITSEAVTDVGLVGYAQFLATHLA